MPSPAATGGHLAEVLPAAAAVLGVPGFDDALGLGGSRRHVVVLLVDGLGAEDLARHADLAPALAGAGAGTIAAAVPTTTATGLTTLGTGLTPVEHGMVGASFVLPETDRVLHPLGWRGDPSPRAVQPEPTVLERAAGAGIAVDVVSPRAYEGSGLSEAALRGAAYRGADSVGERVGETLAALGRSDRSLTYCYWPDLDRTGHIHGVESEHWRAELGHVDYLVRSLHRTLPQGGVLVVTADHGMVDCDTDDRIDLDSHRDLWDGVAAIAGEPRFRHVYARTGAAVDVLAAWQSLLGDAAWVMGRRELLESGWLGSGECSTPERIGDVVAIARDTRSLASDRTDSIVSSLRGQHGSITSRETSIPLVILEGGG